MIWLAIYDVEDDGERAKIASTLLSWGFARVQRSFYVGRLPRGRAQDLALRISRILRGGGHIVFLPSSEEQLEKSIEVGIPPYSPLRPPRRADAVVI